MTRNTLAALAALLSVVSAQQIGRVPENHPRLTTQQCTTHGGCRTQQTSVVLDALSHPIQTRNGVSCETAGGALNTTICPDPTTCAHNCYIEGVNYAQDGVYTQGSSMTLHMYMNESGKIDVPVSPRVYLLDPSGQEYSIIKLLNQEISFDADVSNLPCGMNGALYLTSMPADGGRSRLNQAGAAYGTGYCDAQCPKSTFIEGVANNADYGACCAEMDLWEANVAATQLTPHPAKVEGLVRCNGTDCLNTNEGGLVDEWGCGWNPYSNGDHTYFGPSASDTVDSSKPFTVTTQFLTTDNTSTGTLNQIRRYYTQNGKVIGNSVTTLDGATIDSITPAYCNATASTFEDAGGFPAMSKNLAGGMVLIFSIWNDVGGNMSWLDSGNAGPCNVDASAPSVIVKEDPTTSVTFSNIRWGDINSTFGTQQESGGHGHGWPWGPWGTGW